VADVGHVNGLLDEGEEAVNVVVEGVEDRPDGKVIPVRLQLSPVEGLDDDVARRNLPEDVAIR
jgi:hypothetical protein